jgi:hypothetical protein
MRDDTKMLGDENIRRPALYAFASEMASAFSEAVEIEI